MEQKLNQVMACIDLSQYSQITLEYAIALAKSDNSEILLLSVINQRDIGSLEMMTGFFPGCYTPAMDIREYVDNVRSERQYLLEKMLTESYPEIKEKTRIIIDQGVPFECIIKTAEEQCVDVIVMANKGRGNLKRTLFGGTAEKVFRHSPVPVFSVRDKERFVRTS